MAKSKPHPLDGLTFKAPKLEDAPTAPATEQPTVAISTPEPPSQPVKAPEVTTVEEETRSSNVTLPARMWEWIDTKHAEARSKGGKPLRKAAIIRAVFEVAMAVDVDLSNTQTEDELVMRLNSAIRQ